MEKKMDNVRYILPGKQTDVRVSKFCFNFFQRDSILPSITYFFLFFVLDPRGGVTGRLEFKLPYGNFFLLSAGCKTVRQQSVDVL